MNIEELENSIKYYATKYYNGQPEITDAQFDTLVDTLRLLKPDSAILTTGWGFEVDKDKVKHKYSHIGSLDKTKTYEDIPERFKGKTVYLSPKLDGLSAVVYYNKGKLIKAITRGNGEYGKDITDKIKIILGSEIQDKSFTGAVRGELIIHNDNWLLLQQKYPNLIAQRNFAAGIINRKDIDEDIKYIDLVVYKIVGQENGDLYTDRKDVLDWLSINFEKHIPICNYPILDGMVWENRHKSTFDYFLQLGYPLDGIVLTNPVVSFNYQTNGYIYDEVAFKFNAETDETTIKEIEWTLSRTQRMIPVAIVEPVSLSGAIIERATCNNAQMVKDMCLGKGAKIEIQRANEVIPFIVSVIEESEEKLPEVCPVCGSKLVWDGVDLKCANKNCDNIKYSDLQQWCECIGQTDGLQWTLMNQYLDLYNIHSITDLYKLENMNYILTDLRSRKISITEQKILEFFEKLYIKPIPANKALQALNIPRLGDKTSQLLASEQLLVIQYLIDCINSVESPTIQSSIVDKQKLLDIVKDATTQSLYENKDKFYNLRYLFSADLSQTRLVFEQKVQQSEIKYIAVTGALQTMKRKDFEQLIKQHGYELSSNLKKCIALITNTPDSGSSKNKQAKEYMLPIITEKQFLETLK